MLFEGAPPPYDELLEAIERRLHLVPRYRQRLAFVPLGQGRPKWVDDPHLNLRYHVRSTALPVPGLRAAAQGPRRPRVLPAARPRQAALGDLARRGPRGRPLRDALEDPPRARGRHLRRRHHVRALRHLARARRAHRPGRPLAAAPAAHARAAARRGAARARHDPGARSRARCARCSAARAASSRARATPRWASARWRGPGLNPAPTSPYNQSIGPHRRFTWVRADLARHQGDQERARRHRQRRRAGHRGRRARQAPAPPRPEHGRPRAQGDDPGERARRRRARRARQPGRGDDGAAAGLVPGPGGAARHRARGAARASSRAARRWAPRCSPTCPASRRRP